MALLVMVVLLTNLLISGSCSSSPKSKTTTVHHYHIPDPLPEQNTSPNGIRRVRRQFKDTGLLFHGADAWTQRSIFDIVRFWKTNNFVMLSTSYIDKHHKIDESIYVDTETNHKASVGVLFNPFDERMMIHVMGRQDLDTSVVFEEKDKCSKNKVINEYQRKKMKYMMNPNRQRTESEPGRKYSWISCVNEEYSKGKYAIPEDYHRETWKFFNRDTLLDCLKQTLDQVDRSPFRDSDRPYGPFTDFDRPYGPFTEVVISAPFEAVLAVVQLRDMNYKTFEKLCYLMRQHDPELPCLKFEELDGPTDPTNGKRLKMISNAEPKNTPA